MAVRHNYYPLFGLQFHPESIATEEGGKLIRAFNRSKRGGKSMNNYLRKLVEGQHLTEEEMYKAGLLLLSENILESEIAAFLVLLKAKGETAEEIYGLVRALREKALRFRTIYKEQWTIAGRVVTVLKRLILAQHQHSYWQEQV